MITTSEVEGTHTVPKIVVHEERRRDLADAVLALAARRGVGSVTTRAVAEEAGWSIGVINHYFDSRHDLLYAGLQRASELQIAVYDAILARKVMAAEKLVSLTDSVLPLDERRLAMTRVFLFFYAEGTASEAARSEIAGLLARWRRMIRDVAAAGQAAGDASIDAGVDVRLLAQHLTALTDGLALEAVLDPEVMAAVREPDAVARVVRTALRGATLGDAE